MAFVRVLLGLILAVAPAAVAQAQIVLPSDVSVALTASPTTNLQPGQPIDMTLTVTNYGPAAVPIFVLSSSIFVDELNLVSVNSAECFLVLDVADLPNGTAEYRLDWNVAGLGGVLPPMPAGVTLPCHFQIALTRSAPSTYNFSFGLPPTYETDPNPTNDRGTVTLQRAAAAALPTPLPALSTTMLCLLAGLSAAFAAHALRRQRRPANRPRFNARRTLRSVEVHKTQAVSSSLISVRCKGRTRSRGVVDEIGNYVKFTGSA